MLRETAFIEFEIRTDDDNRTTRVVDAFTKKILAEVALLTFQIISE